MAFMFENLEVYQKITKMISGLVNGLANRQG